MGSKSDTFTWNNTEIALAVVGVCYLLMFAGVLWRLAIKELVALSHRFRYVVLLIGVVFIRGLCSFIGVSEAQYAKQHENSVLPFLLFDVGNMAFVVMVLAMIGAQFRNALSCNILTERGIISKFGYNRRELTSGLRDSNNDQLNVYRDMNDIPSRQEIEMKLTTIHRISLFIYALVCIMITAYCALSFDLYAQEESGKDRNQSEQIFFIVVYVIVIILLISSTMTERRSGCLIMQEQEANGDNTESVDNEPGNNESEEIGSVNADSEDIECGNNEPAAFRIDYGKESKYAKRQWKIAFTMLLILLLRIAWSVFQIYERKSNEFDNRWYWIVIEYAIELVLLSTIFWLLLHENFSKGETEDHIIHGPYDTKDPYFILSLLRRFSQDLNPRFSLRLYYSPTNFETRYLRINDVLRMLGESSQGFSPLREDDTTGHESPPCHQVRQRLERIEQLCRSSAEASSATSERMNSLNASHQENLDQFRNDTVEELNSLRESFRKSLEEIKEEVIEAQKRTTGQNNTLFSIRLTVENIEDTIGACNVQSIHRVVNQNSVSKGPSTGQAQARAGAAQHYLTTNLLENHSNP